VRNARFLTEGNEGKEGAGQIQSSFSSLSSVKSSSNASTLSDGKQFPRADPQKRDFSNDSGWSKSSRTRRTQPNLALEIEEFYRRQQRKQRFCFSNLKTFVIFVSFC
jgi:hypothetical protein